MSAIRAAAAGSRALRGDGQKTRVLARDPFDAAARHRTELVHTPFYGVRCVTLQTSAPTSSIHANCGRATPRILLANSSGCWGWAAGQGLEALTPLCHAANASVLGPPGPCSANSPAVSPRGRPSPLSPLNRVRPRRLRQRAAKVPCIVALHPRGARWMTLAREVPEPFRRDWQHV